MLNFVQQFMYYVCFEVLEPNWVLMEQKIKKATTVEEVLTIHSDFQDTCLKECMLTTPNSLKVKMIFIYIIVRLFIYLISLIIN